MDKDLSQATVQLEGSNYRDKREIIATA